MKQIFLCILSLSFSGALTGLLLLCLRPLTKRFFSKKWNYYIWMLVVIRLLIPVYVELPYSFPWSSYGTTASPDYDRVYQQMQEETPFGDAAEPESEMEAQKPERSWNDKQAADENRLEIPFMIAEIVWLLGAAAALMIQGGNYFCFVRRIKAACEEVSDQQMTELFAELSARIAAGGNRKRAVKRPAIYESASVASPVTLGLWKPVIILPKDITDRNQMKMMLHHELLHVKRKDLWVKWLYRILLCVHWFNPVLYPVGRKINADCELSCDEAVLKELTEEGKKAYGNLLLDAAERNIDLTQQTLATSFVGRIADLKERLYGILHYKKQSRWKVLLSGCVCVAVLLLSACGSVDIGDEMPVRLSGDDLADWYTGYWDELFSDGTDSVQSFLKEPMVVDEEGEAYRAYEDQNLLAGEDVSDREYYSFYKGGDSIKCSGIMLNGTSSVLILYAEEDTDILVDSSFDVTDGRFKIVHALPDGTVELLDDSGKAWSGTVTCPAGRNAIKLAGQKARLKDLRVSFAGLSSRKIEQVYYSEEEEYAGSVEKAWTHGEPLDKEKMMQALPYMDGKTVSHGFACLLQQGESFTVDELYDILIYSDDDLSSRYWLGAIEEGKAQPPDGETITKLMPYLSDQAVEGLLACMEGELTSEQFDEMLPYLNEETMLELLTGREELTFELICECAPYLSQKSMERCLTAYIESGHRLTYSEFDEISPYLDKGAIDKIDALSDR